MSYHVIAISRPEVAGGLGLAGVATTEASSAAQAAEQVERLRARPDVGVILLEEMLYQALGEDLRRDLGRRPLPMIVPFPGPAWQERPEGAEAYIVELLRQVVGYRVRLK